MNVPTFDGDVLALRGWINREGIIPPSGQGELREAVGRVLNKLEAAETKEQRLRDACETLVAAGEPNGISDDSLYEVSPSLLAAMQEARRALQ